MSRKKNFPKSFPGEDWTRLTSTTLTLATVESRTKRKIIIIKRGRGQGKSVTALISATSAFEPGRKKPCVRLPKWRLEKIRRVSTIAGCHY